MKIRAKQATPIRTGSHAFMVEIDNRRQRVIYIREEGERDQHEVEIMFADLDMVDIDPKTHTVCSVPLTER